MKKILIILAIAIAFVLNGCFSDFEGRGSIAIDFSGTSITASDGTELPEGYYYTIELVNGPGDDIKIENISAASPPQSITVNPGRWLIVVKVYLEDGTLYAMNEPQTINIKPGNNNVINIKISRIDGSLIIEYSAITFNLTPLNGERTGSVDVTIQGLKDDDTADVVFSETIPGISLSGNTNLDNGTHTITFTYNGTSAVTTPGNQRTLTLTNYDNTKYTSISGSRPTINVTVYDGIVAARPIPVRQVNITAFNTYADTADGLNKHYVLEEDIDLAGIVWKPVGFADYRDRESYLEVLESSIPFTGSFDGGNNTIIGLNINESEKDFQGLFEYIGANGTVKNLQLIGVDITGERQVGGIAAHNRGIIENCFVSGNIKGRATVGGIAGHNEGTVDKSGKITGTVTTDGINDTKNYTDAGGVVGYNAGTVSNSFNRGKVSCSHLTGRNVGGVAGYNERTGTTAVLVTKCYNTGEVEGKADYAGGIVGWNSGGTVSYCVSLGVSVSGTADLGRVIGSNYVASGTAGAGSNNYARDDLPLLAGAGQNVLNGLDGLNTANWNTEIFWASTVGFTDPWWTGKLPPTVPAIP